MLDRRLQDASRAASEVAVPEDASRLMILERNGRVDIDNIVESLRKDFVVLARNVPPQKADEVVRDTAEEFGLRDSLELQAGFASLYGHRHNIGKYFMSVNAREDYQFVTPHSEGDSFSNMQLASFYCFENSTDGGTTILFNLGDSIEMWQSMREMRTRARATSRSLTSREIERARAQYRINFPHDTLRDDDLVLNENQSEICGLSLVDVLAKPTKAYSRVLGRQSYVYWDSIASVDHDSVQAYVRLLRQADLLIEPPCGLDIRQMDSVSHRRLWHSRFDHAHLFRCKITIKLVPGDLLIQNNLTWAHSVSNWSPKSGVRRVAAAFA